MPFFSFCFLFHSLAYVGYVRTTPQQFAGFTDESRSDIPIYQQREDAGLTCKSSRSRGAAEANKRKCGRAGVVADTA